ncbi:MAG: metallophosphoesterase [Acidimicrobiales bacterium]
MDEGTGDLEGTKRHIVVISDVHLGTLAPTVWYQPHLHEPYLLRLLGWVERNAAHVRELVLLGDIVELWTYPADEEPPTFADIVAAHPAVLGPDGALARLVDALDGAVTYVPGNHDMGVTAEEVGLVRSRRTGRAVRLVEDVPYLPAPRVAMAHGHHWTLFNAPASGPWGELPLGYFVTRAVATRWKHQLGEGETVAGLAGQGANGIDMGSLGRIVSGRAPGPWPPPSWTSSPGPPASAWTWRSGCPVAAPPTSTTRGTPSSTRGRTGPRRRVVASPGRPRQRGPRWRTSTAPACRGSRSASRSSTTPTSWSWATPTPPSAASRRGSWTT